MYFPSNQNGIPALALMAFVASMLCMLLFGLMLLSSSSSSSSLSSSLLLLLLCLGTVHGTKRHTNHPGKACHEDTNLINDPTANKSLPGKSWSLDLIYRKKVQQDHTGEKKRSDNIESFLLSGLNEDRHIPDEHWDGKLTAVGRNLLRYQADNLAKVTATKKQLQQKWDTALTLGVKLHSIMDPHIDQLIVSNEGRPLALNESQWWEVMVKESALMGFNLNQYLRIKTQNVSVSEKLENGTFVMIKASRTFKHENIVMIQYIVRDPALMKYPIPVHTPDPDLLEEFLIARNFLLSPPQDMYLEDNSYMESRHFHLPARTLSKSTLVHSIHNKEISSNKGKSSESPSFSSCKSFAIIKCQADKEFENRLLCDQLDTNGGSTGRVYPLQVAHNIHTISSLKCPASLYRGENFIFVRIPKTGSKFVLRHIKATLGGYLAPHLHDPPRGWCFSGVETMPWDMCTHHLKKLFRITPKPFCVYKFHTDIMDATMPFVLREEKFHTVTFIKDPVDRVISEYKHISGNNVSNWWDYAPISYEPKSREGFLYFFNDPVNAKGMRNRQTKMMAGCGMVNCRDIYPSSEQMLEKAKQNLRNTLYFGISNMMERSIRVMYRTFGYDVKLFVNSTKLQRMVRERNDGRTLFDVDSHVIQQIVATNELDVKLYLYALKLFKERFEAYDDL